MLGGLLLVLAAMSQLKRPETHQAIGAALGEPNTAGQAAVLAVPAAEPLVTLKTFAAVIDNSPFRNDEQPAWFAVLAAVATADADNLGRRSMGVVGYAPLSAQPDAYRGRVVAVRGTALRVDRVTPAENVHGIDTLWRVTLQPTGGEVWPITVYTIEEPPTATEPYETVATGVFYKKLSYRWAEGVGSTPVIVAKRLGDRLLSPNPLEPNARTKPSNAESPIAFQEPSGGSLGRKLLADLGVNLGALDTLADRQPLLARESEAFYALLGAVDRTPAPQLVRLARVGLDDYVARRLEQPPATRRDQLRMRAIAEAHDAGGYSVVPLFGAGASERGELLVIDTVVRRAVRIDASASRAAGGAGVDHYYELECFPEDSQNLPVVFVVRDLPAGFPRGESIRQPARLAGFFFKQWAYRTRKRVEGRPTLDKRQFAPLLVGRAPIPLATPDASRSRPGLAIGVVATLALVGLVAALWRLSNHDRVYAATTLVRYREPSDPLDFERLKHLSEPP